MAAHQFRRRPLKRLDTIKRQWHFGQTMLGVTEDQVNRHECVDCGTLSPQTETNYTLISSQYGWRLSRGKDESGRATMQWRCPKCWSRFKTQGAAR